MTRRAVRRLVRPAAPRPRRARPPREGGARARAGGGARLGRSGPQARRDARRRAAAARPGRVPRRRGRARRARAHGRHAARAPRVGRPGLPDRRRRVLATSSTWKEPEEVLRRTRLAVATRPGFPRERLDAGARRSSSTPSACASSSSSRRPSPRATCAPASRRARTCPTRCRLRLRRSWPARASTPALRATLGPLEADRTSPPDRGARAGQARSRRGHPRHATRLCVHGLLRRVHGRQPAPDEGDLGRGARAPEGGERPDPAFDRGRRRGDVDHRRLRRRRAARLHPRGAASSTASRSCGTTSRTRRSKQPRPKRTCLQNWQQSVWFGRHHVRVLTTNQKGTMPSARSRRLPLSSGYGVSRPLDRGALRPDPRSAAAAPACPMQVGEAERRCGRRRFARVAAARRA